MWKKFPNDSTVVPYAKTSLLTSEVRIKDAKGDDSCLFSCSSKAETVKKTEAFIEICEYARCPRNKDDNVPDITRVKDNELKKNVQKSNLTPELQGVLGIANKDTRVERQVSTEKTKTVDEKISGEQNEQEFMYSLRRNAGIVLILRVLR